MVYLGRDGVWCTQGTSVCGVGGPGSGHRSGPVLVG